MASNISVLNHHSNHHLLYGTSYNSNSKTEIISLDNGGYIHARYEGTYNNSVYSQSLVFQVFDSENNPVGNKVTVPPTGATTSVNYLTAIVEATGSTYVAYKSTDDGIMNDGLFQTTNVDFDFMYTNQGYGGGIFQEADGLVTKFIANSNGSGSQDLYINRLNTDGVATTEAVYEGVLPSSQYSTVLLGNGGYALTLLEYDAVSGEHTIKTIFGDGTVEARSEGQLLTPFSYPSVVIETQTQTTVKVIADPLSDLTIGVKSTLLKDGSVLVSWTTGDNVGNMDSFQTKTYNSDGTLLSSSLFNLDTLTSNINDSIDVTGYDIQALKGADGGFIVVWDTSGGPMLQLFNNDATPKSDMFLAREFGFDPAEGSNYKVSVLEDGSFIFYGDRNPEIFHYNSTSAEIDSNNSPTANTDIVSITQGTQINIDVLSNDTDSNTGDTLQVNSVSATTGEVSINADGTIYYRHYDTDNSTSAVIKYTVVDNKGGADSGIVNLSITPTSEVNLVSDINISMQENEDLNNVVVNQSDSTVSVINATALNGTVSINADFSLNYTPDVNFYGHDQITFTGVNQQQQADVATVFVNVQNSNVNSEEEGLRGNYGDFSGADESKIVALENNGYAVVWGEYTPTSNSGLDPSVSLYVQTYNADGSIQKNKFLVGSDYPMVKEYDVVALADGGFGIRYATADGEKFSQFDSTGTIVGAEYNVTSQTLNVLELQYYDWSTAPFVFSKTLTIDGDLGLLPLSVLDYERTNDFAIHKIDNDDYVTAERYTNPVYGDRESIDAGSIDITYVKMLANGTSTTKVSQKIDAGVGLEVTVTDISILNSGNTVVLFTADNNTYAKIVSPLGNGLGTVIIDKDNSYLSKDAKVSVLADGGFVVSWISDQNGVDDVWARKFSDNGNPTTNMYQVNTSTNNDNNSVVVESLLDGSIIYTWQVESQDLRADGRVGNMETIVKHYPANNAPAIETHIKDYRADTNEQIVIEVVSNYVDQDGDTLTVTVQDPDNGTAVVNFDNTITYSFDALYTGDDIVSYTIFDGQGAAITDSVIVKSTGAVVQTDVKFGDIVVPVDKSLNFDFMNNGVDIGRDMSIRGGDAKMGEDVGVFDALRLEDNSIYDMGIDVLDTVLLMKHIAGVTDITGNGVLSSDINNDGIIDVSDAVLTLKHIVSIINIDTFDMVDEFSNQITSIDMLNTADSWSLIANGDIDSSGGFI